MSKHPMPAALKGQPWSDLLWEDVSQYTTALDRLAVVPQQGVVVDVGGNIGRHSGHLRRWPGKQKVRPEATTAHAIVTCPVGTSDDHRELGYARRRHGIDHLGAIFGDAGPFGIRPDHEASNIVKKQERNIPLVAHLDEVSGL